MQLQNSVVSSLNDNLARIQNAKAKVDELLSSLLDGMISANIRRIQECHLLLIFRTVACLGLEKWAPDILSGDPESMYNLLHEHIALKTFEQVSSAYGYSHMGANLSCVHDFALMHKLYRSFVFSYMYGIAKSEVKSPGSVARGKQMTSVWKQCSVVCILLLLHCGLCLTDLNSLLQAGLRSSKHMALTPESWPWLMRMRPILMMS